MLHTHARTFGLSLLAWLFVGTFWYVATRSFHPTTHLAILVTAALVGAYAIAAYINQLYLIPHFWRRGRTAAYLGSLLTMMFLLTAAALTIVRTAYLRSLGPDPDPNGLVKHFAIDFAGMVVHLIGAAVTVRLYHRLTS